MVYKHFLPNLAYCVLSILSEINQTRMLTVTSIFIKPFNSIRDQRIISVTANNVIDYLFQFYPRSTPVIPPHPLLVSYLSILSEINGSLGLITSLMNSLTFNSIRDQHRRRVRGPGFQNILLSILSEINPPVSFSRIDSASDFQFYPRSTLQLMI